MSPPRRPAPPAATPPGRTPPVRRGLRWALIALAAVALLAAGWKVLRPVVWAWSAGVPPLPLAPMVDAGLDGEGGGAVDADGHVWVWGEAMVALRGAPITSPPRREAVRARGVGDVVQLAVGERALLALLRDGTVRATGCNGWGILGVPAVVRNACTRHDEWLPLPGLTQVVQLAVGRASAYAVRRDGSVWAWGRDAVGTVQMQPGPVPTLANVKAIALEGLDVGAGTVLYGLGRDGSLWAWGSMHRLGREGRAPDARAAAPLMLADLGSVQALPARPLPAVMGGGMAAVRADGTVVHFGGATSSVCSPRGADALPLPMTVPGLRDVATVAVRHLEILAMGRDGSLWHWGDVSVGTARGLSQGCMDSAQQLLPAGSIRALSASSAAVLAWRTEGGVLAWGHDVVLNAHTMNLPIAWADRQQVVGPR